MQSINYSVDVPRYAMNKKIALSLTLSLVISGTSYASKWNYDEHGDDWHDGICATGMSQSPVNIDTGALTYGNYTANMNYEAKTAEAENNGHTVQFNPNGRMLEIVDNVSQTLEKFTLVQFHLHNGSEHTVDGVRHDLEAHFVHANNAYLAGEAGGRLAVIGVFLNGGSTHTNKKWNKTLENLPQYKDGQGEIFNKTIESNYYKYLPHTTSVYTYKGSLTTPNCNEIVNWIVMQDPITISHEAVENFAASQKKHHATYRNTQPLNGRIITAGDIKGTRN